LNLQALEVFCEVVRRQSFSRGAATCGISQSAASQLVAHLEEELGFQLIDRRHRPLQTTVEGARYFAGCQELLHHHRALLDEIRRHQKALSDTVRVASIYSAGLHTLSQYLGRFMSRYPGATVRLEYFHPSKVHAVVLDEEADIGVTSYPKPNRQLCVIPWVEERMVLACPPGHRLSRLTSMRLEQLEGESFVAFDHELKIRQEIDRTLRKHHVGVKIVSEFDNIETIKHALEISRAVSILPHPSIEREVHRGTLVEVVIEDIDLRRPVGIIHKRGKKLTLTAQQFISSLVEDSGK
jgi:DNA-binding transcriptional LysR family regulator